ncbi:ABC transporter permease subunit [Thiocapsa sp.]|uniref:ABC transporter permease n=1 Tax=Thiocapsa sp. TaxID=2024551 RepID=UPI0025EA1AEF|nr:ABC transporter permease subunit [Thiocapsa sp.]
MSNIDVTAKTYNLPWLAQAMDWLAGDGAERAAGGLIRHLLLPLIGIGLFLMLWAAAASQIQIWTSLVTVMVGFLLASLIAIPLGILCGMSAAVYAAVNPLIQVFKPVSPLAWLPLVTIIVSAVYVSDDPLLSKSFIISAMTVTLCCLWPTVINTTVGVATVDRDLMNVSRVLRLTWFKQTVKIILPSALPMIFTGLRLSLGIGWMVLIAAEMLAQNPGLGKFVWDEFQNGSSNSLARIMVAVFVIGFIGFALDRGMLML